MNEGIPTSFCNISVSPLQPAHRQQLNTVVPTKNNLSFVLFLTVRSQPALGMSLPRPLLCASLEFLIFRCRRLSLVLPLHARNCPGPVDSRSPPVLPTYASTLASFLSSSVSSSLILLPYFLVPLSFGLSLSVHRCSPPLPIGASLAFARFCDEFGCDMCVAPERRILWRSQGTELKLPAALDRPGIPGRAAGAGGGTVT